MFGLGFGHLLLLAAIGLIVLGPEQMTELARVLGRTVAELKKAMREVTSSVSLEPHESIGEKVAEKSRVTAREVTPNTWPDLSSEASATIAPAQVPPLPKLNAADPPLPPVPTENSIDQNEVFSAAPRGAVSEPTAVNPLSAPLTAPALAAQMKFELKPERPLAEDTKKDST